MMFYQLSERMNLTQNFFVRHELARDRVKVETILRRSHLFKFNGLLSIYIARADLPQLPET